MAFAAAGTSDRAFAQYNETFYNTANWMGVAINEYAIDIRDLGNGHTCVLTGNVGGSADFTIKELDFNGTVVRYETFTVPSGYLRPSRVLQAANGDILVVGYDYDASATNPFAARFTPSGTSYVNNWFYVYASNGSYLSIPTRMSEANIVLAVDDPTESYIITGAGDDVGTPNVGDMTVNALKIDAAGNLLWNYKYYDMAGASWRTIYPRALATGDGDRKQKYFLAGYADYNTMNAQSFDMTIDVNGNIVDQYREYFVPSYSFGHDAIYDASTDEFILTYTFGNSGVVGLPVVSQIALTKIAANSMTINSTDIYYENDPAAGTIENYSNSIKLDAIDRNYILSCWVMNWNSNYHTTALLKVDKFSTVQFFKRYNKYTPEFHGAVADVLDPMTGMENYVEVENSITTYPDTRVFSTNTAGVTCGDEDIHPGQMHYGLKPIYHTFGQVSMSGGISLPLNSGNAYTSIPCNPANPNYKTTTVASVLPDQRLTVFPTVLNGTTGDVHIDAMSMGTTDMNVSICSMDGKVLEQKAYHLQSGSNTVSCNVNLPTAGSYVMKIYSADGQLNKTVRLTRL